MPKVQAICVLNHANKIEIVFWEAARLHKRARAKKALRTASAVGIVLGGAILDPNNVVLALYSAQAGGIVRL